MSCKVFFGRLNNKKVGRRSEKVNDYFGNRERDCLLLMGLLFVV